MTTTPTTVTFTLGSAALSDHLARLYQPHHEVLPECYRHVDCVGAEISVQKWMKTTATASFTREALGDFISDMAYQVEFATEDFERAYRGQCKRALATAKAARS